MTAAVKVSTFASRQPGTIIASCAAAPFAVGALAYHTPGGHIHGPSLWPCPFRTLTGLPCPMCGATRTVVLLSHGNTGFLRYNPVWAVVLVAVFAYGMLLSVRSLTGNHGHPAVLRRFASRAGAVRLLLGLLALGWCCSLAHAKAITGHSL